MALPVGIETFTGTTGPWTDFGGNEIGSVTVSLSPILPAVNGSTVEVVHLPTGRVLMPRPITFTTSADGGAASITAPVCDATGLNVSNFTYKLSVTFPRGTQADQLPDRTFQITKAAAAAAAGPIDLDLLSDVPTIIGDVAVAGLATVATSGSYNDLFDKPAIGGSALTVQDENANVSTAVSRIDFQGAGVTVAAGTGEVVVTIPGGGTVSTASTTAQGIVELATTAETQAGTDTARAVTPAAASATYVPKLVPTATKTAAYTAAVGDLAMMNVAGGGITLTLPTAPADKAQVGYRAVGATTAIPLTINRGGTTDTIGDSGGTTVTAPLSGESTVYQYDAANTRWIALSNVKPLTALDARYTAAGTNYDTGLSFTDSTGMLVPDLQLDLRGQFKPEVISRLATRQDQARTYPTRRIIRTLPDAQMAQLKQAQSNANKYMLNAWLPARFPGTAAITTLGGTGEDNVRHPAAAALAIAIAIYTNTHDKTATGVTSLDAATAAVRVIKGIATQHVATTAGGWGGGGQSAHWAQCCGAAAWLLWNKIDATTQGIVNAMMTSEANRFLGSSATYWKRYDGTELFAGDTKAEEEAWNGGLLSLAPIMQPGHANAVTWRTKANVKLISAGLMPNDVTAGRTVQNIKLGESFDGWNLNQDGTLVNHFKIHPDYMCSIAELAWSAGVFMAHQGTRIPVAYTLNAETVYRALSMVQFGTRTIYTPGSADLYYPQGDDWGPGRITDKVMTDTLAHCLGLDAECSTPAATWLSLHLQRQLDMQARGTSGQTYYTDAEDIYGAGATPGGREPWVARNLGLAILAALMPSTTRYSNADLVVS